MITIVDPSITYRGISHYAENLKELLTSAGYMVCIVKPRNKNRLYSIIWEVLGLYFVIARKGDILIHVSGRIGLVPALVCQRNVMVIHDLMRVNTNKVRRSGNLEKKQYLDIMRIYQTMLFFLGLRRSRLLICNSFYVKAELREQLGLTGVCVLYPPASFSKGDILAAVSGEQSLISRNTSKKYGLWICGGTPNKNFYKGIEWTRGSSRPIELSILGISDKMQPEFLNEDKIEKRIQYKFEGFIAKNILLERYLTYSFCLCLSNEEGFGIPFLDALMFDLPIIATKIPTYLEIYRLVQEGIVKYSSAILWVDLDAESIVDELNKVNNMKPRMLDRRVAYCRNLKSFREFNARQYSEINDWC